jgi:hypothetical protein
MKSLMKEIKQFLIDGNINNASIIRAEDELTYGELASIVDDLRSGFDEFNFVKDTSLDVVSQFKNINIVKDKYLTSAQVDAFLGGLLLTQPWMTAQTCALSALINKKYTFYRESNSELYQALYSWPCLIDRDHRVVVPATSETDFFFVICDEYFGFPDGVFNFRDLTYFSHGWSPITRQMKDGISSMLKSVISWYFYTKKSFLNQPKTSLAAKEVQTYLLLGGALNPSHIIWNYLGGLDLATRTGNCNNIDYVVQTTDMFYSFNVEAHKYIRLDHMQPLHQIKKLVDMGLNHSLCAKLSDAGNNPRVADSIYKLSVGRMARDLGIVPGVQPRLPNSLYSFNNKPVRIVVSIRTGRRKIDQQVNFFVSIFALLLECIPQIQIIFDGSAAGPTSNQEQELEVSRSIVAEFSKRHQSIASSISYEHAIGESMGFQSIVYKGADSYITYFSGGNAKILNFIKGIGVLMSPISETSAKYLGGFNFKVANKSGLCVDIASCVFSESDIFVQSHDYVGYGSDFQPPLLCMGEPIESTSKSINRAGFDNNFHGDFVLDPNIVSQQLLKCIYYNSLMYSSFKGLNL